MVDIVVLNLISGLDFEISDFDHGIDEVPSKEDGNRTK